MTSFSKPLAVIVLCGAILGAWQLANREGSFRELPISVSVETAPCNLRGGEKIKIALKAEVNGTGVRHGRVVVHVRPLDGMAATDPVDFQPVEGHTDHNGTFITNWRPPCPGKYLVCAEVSKSRCTCGRAESHFTLSNQGLSGGTPYDSKAPLPPNGIRSGI